ncbi:MAG: hypothetical protein N3B16_00200 [Candidatus Aminicenantes bacterium]|nr:hypothetical protein [Candidatus Aminicenantes bacterium]
MRRKENSFLLAVIVLSLGILGWKLWAQQLSQLVGDWQMVVEAEGQYFYLNLSFKETEGKFEGTVSEANGFFSHLPLINIKFEADKLTFDFNAPTPPDGLSRLITAELKISADYEKMEGTLFVHDLDIIASVKVTRKK